uniref:CUB domain-containing protein n=2 Tax=Arion vulgaris TaxID=1028688 RepID=A0A0B7AQ46_9EUPU
MRYLILTALTTAIVVLFVTPVIYSISCIQVCDGNNNAIVCNQSLILISDVTNLTMDKDHQAFENTKRDCMSRASCDTSRVCSARAPHILLVHYLCVNASSILSRSCSKTGVKMNESTGYIQSPEYPAGTPGTGRCSWEIQAPSASAVVLLLHDIVIKNDKEKCKEALVVSGQLCTFHQPGQTTNVKYFCGNDNTTTSLTLCGNVNIVLKSNRSDYEKRFWLSFQVLTVRSTVETSYNPISRCSGPIIGMDQGRRHEEPLTTTTTTESVTMSGINSQDSNTEVLVIMLSMISGISAVLLVILIIVCIRWRLLQASHSEHTCSDRSQSVQVHYDYTSSSEMEKIRPQLADGYFQVADALPFVQRVEDSNSPAYVEVEQFAQLRKMLRPSYSDDDSRGSKSLNEEKPYDLKNAVDNQAEKTESSRHKHRVLNKLKGERNKQGKREINNLNNKSSINSKILPAFVNTEVNSNNNPVLFQKEILTQLNSEDEGCSHYETIDMYSSIKSCSNSLNRSHDSTNSSLSVRLPADILRINSSKSEKDYKSVDKAKDEFSLYSEISSTTQQVPEFLDITCTVMNKTKKTDCLNKTVATGLNERSKTLPSKSSKACLKTLQAKNINCRQNAFRDMPQASGIVKNSIKKFEQNSA